MGRPTLPDTEKRQRLDVRLSPTTLVKIEQGLEMASHLSTKTDFIEAAIDYYWNTLQSGQVQQAPLAHSPEVGVAVAVGQKPTLQVADTIVSATWNRDELEQIDEMYRDDQDQVARPLKPWLHKRYPRPTRPLTSKQLRYRKEVDPLGDLAARLLADQRIWEQATKNDYLVQLHRSGYSYDDLRYMHNLWVDFRKAATAVQVPTFPEHITVQATQIEVSSISNMMICTHATKRRFHLALPLGTIYFKAEEQQYSVAPDEQGYEQVKQLWQSRAAR